MFCFWTGGPWCIAAPKCQGHRLYDGHGVLQDILWSLVSEIFRILWWYLLSSQQHSLKQRTAQWDLSGLLTEHLPGLLGAPVLPTGLTASVALLPFRSHPLKIHSGMPESVILGPVCDFWGSWGRKMRGDHLALCIPGGLADVTNGALSMFLFCAWFICTVTKYLFKLMIVFK